MNPNNTLIATPFSDFGKLICDSLKDGNPGQVSFFTRYKDVVDSLAAWQSLDYALIDMDLGISKVTEIAYQVRSKFPQVCMILMSKKDPSPEADKIAPWKLLKKPFIEGDLIDLISNPTEFKQNQVIEGKFKDTADLINPEWLINDQNLQETLLASLNDVDAAEAFIYSENKVLAQTSSISPVDIKDCAWILQGHIGGKERGEVIKEVSLQEDRYLLHGMIIAVGIVLAILYQKDTPYKILRNQSRYLATRITNPQLSVQGMLSLPERITTEISHVDAFDPAQSREKKDQHRKQMHSWRSRKINPNHTGSESAIHPQQAQDDHDLEDDGKGSIEEPEDNSDADEKGGTWSLEMPEPDLGVIPSSLDSDEAISSMDIGSWKVASQPVPAASIGIPFPTRSTAGSGSMIRSKPVSGLLSYVCLLIPRFKSDLLINDLARFLKEEIPEIFLAHGWRLEGIRVASQYMQWTVAISPSVSPARHIKTIRKESSRMILDNFTHFQHNGLIDDFWAPGHLLETGKQPISEQEISRFIQENRSYFYPQDQNDRTRNRQFMQGA